MKEPRQTQLQLDPVTVSQATRQLDRRLRVRGCDYSSSPEEAAVAMVKEERIQLKLNFAEPSTSSGVRGPSDSSTKISRNLPLPSELDPEFLAALPADILDEIFDGYAARTRAGAGNF